MPANCLSRVVTGDTRRAAGFEPCRDRLHAPCCRWWFRRCASRAVSRSCRARRSARRARRGWSRSGPAVAAAARPGRARSTPVRNVAAAHWRSSARGRPSHTRPGARDRAGPEGPGRHPRRFAYMAAAIARRAPPGLLEGVLVPAPAHPERMRRHGHNQAREHRRGARPRRRACPSGTSWHAGRAACGRWGWSGTPAGRTPRGGIIAGAGLGDGSPGGARGRRLHDRLHARRVRCARCRAAGSGPVTAVCFARTVRAIGCRWRRSRGARSMGRTCNSRIRTTRR